MLVLLLSSLLLRERITFTRLGGILLGAAGALMLILMGNPATLNGGNLSGNLLIMLNTLSWALYLVVSKPLMVKYNAMLLMRWIFLTGFLSVLPFSLGELRTIDFAGFTPYAWFSIGYIIIVTTFIAYFLITYSLKRLSTPVVAYYSYLQPVCVAIIGIMLFGERLSPVKIISALLVFTGIYLVTWRRN
jgi:drug/metabolite transporter (DMT)-like permease